MFVPSRKSGRPAALDVIVTSLLQPSIINHAAENSQHENSCSEQRILFVPLAVESLGGLSATLKKTLRRIALLADNRNYQSQGHVIACDR